MAFSLRTVKPLTHLFNSTNRNHLMADLSVTRTALFHHDFIDPDIAAHRKQVISFCNYTRNIYSLLTLKSGKMLLLNV